MQCGRMVLASNDLHASRPARPSARFVAWPSKAVEAIPRLLDWRRHSRSALKPTIAQRVFLVGALPIAITALMGFLSILLLGRADVARQGALDASTVYRQGVSAMSASDAYLDADPSDRTRFSAGFSASITGARRGLASLSARSPEPEERAAIQSTMEALDRYARQMDQLMATTAWNDGLVAEMDKRLGHLISLTEEARERQHVSNLDIVKTLRARSGVLVATREIVAAQQALRLAIADASLMAASGRAVSEDRLSVSFEAARIRNAYEVYRHASMGRPTPPLDDAILDEDAVLRTNIVAARDSLARLDRQLKVDVTAERTLQTELLELFSYSVEASETEQATQNIAIETLKLGDETGQVIARREGAQIAEIVDRSRALGERISSLPISPLIQSDMLDALEDWREALKAAEEGLRAQGAVRTDMSDRAEFLLLQVASLNATLSANADRIGSQVRQIIVFGGGAAFLLAALAALLTARSITRPLKRLEQGMIAGAFNTGADRMSDTDRRDELGAMARATNRFLTELERRENALRRAKEDTEESLERLRETQSELIQAEKLASLGQLVAGVAHEINTPLGVALTTATVMAVDVERFQHQTSSGGVTKAAFDEFVRRMDEGSRLTVANVERSASLVQSFKRVAADQASGERRTFLVEAFTRDLFTSLGPMGKRAGHRLEIACEPDLEIDSYPGALSQVLTNLLSNVYAHAYRPGETGTITVLIARRDCDELRITFSDDGRGIDAAHRSKIFDPFFTTGRASGSTGLGLHIVYNLVTVTLGGTITLRSNTPRGSTFIIDLPLSAPTPMASEPLA